MLKMTPPQHAAGVLTAMPSDRAAVLLKRLEPPDLARILAATDPARKAVLWALLDVERNAAVLAAMSMPQATELLAALSAERAVAVLEALPPHWSSALLTAMPPEPQNRLLQIMHPQRAAEHRAGIYETHVGWALSRTAARVTRVAEDHTADLLVEAGHWAVHVAIRYRDRGLLTLREVLAEPGVVPGVPVSGLLIVTNAPLSDDVRRYEGRAMDGLPVDVVTWRGHRDDGILYRATVRLVFEPGVTRAPTAHRHEPGEGRDGRPPPPAR
jgi:hypothetical protein